MRKGSKGITLIALVITIVVLLILAGVTISTLTGDNGLLTKAQAAKEKNEDAEIEEQIKLAYQEWQLSEYTGNVEDEKIFLKNKLDSLYENIQDVSVSNNKIIVTFSDGDDIDDVKVFCYNTLSGEFTNPNKDYVGYYADIDANGTVDGVIFADLLTGSIRETQQWGNSYGGYILPTNVTKSNVNTYYISQDSYTDSKFGTHPVISPKSINGEKRFYIMQLSNFITSAYDSFYWYKTANMSDYRTVTSRDFGEGKNNTDKIIAKWNNKLYGEQEDRDIWKHIQTQAENGWFIPSAGEWAAFANELGITKDNYNTIFGFEWSYWSSSQSYENGAWGMRFGNGNLYGDGVAYTYRVRLATTF